METIGLHKIIVPDSEWLLFSDGLKLSAQITEDLQQGLIKGTAKLAILFPTTSSVYVDGEYRRKAEFFVGLLEDTFERIRDDLFPQLKFQANRDKIKEVGKKLENDDPIEILKTVFHTAWITYDPLEKFVSDKIFVGFQCNNGSYVLAKNDSDDWLKDDERAYYRLLGFQAKFRKSLDMMFSNNLRLRHTMLASTQSASKTTPAP